MTSKAVLSQLEVNERRIKAIYDQLESGSFKKAIAEADKVLKKNPNLSPARVLKAVALYRSGRTQESYNIVNEVAKCTPTDENTLSTLSYFFKETNQKNRIVDIYEEAYKQFPNREDICINLFYCHVKSFNYLSQQKVAIQLRKLNASNIEYAMWPMVGNVLHGVYNNDLRLIKLGEAMLSKYFNSNAILSTERIELLIFIMEQLNKYEECFDWLNGLTLKDVVENEQNRVLFDEYKIGLLLKIDRREDAFVLQEKLILLNCDNIRLWKDYIDNGNEIDLKNGNSNSLSSIINTLEESDNSRIAIKVANIHLSIILEKSHTNLSKEFGSKVDKIVEYFLLFSDRPSCIYDIYTFLTIDNCFTVDDRKEMLRRVVDSCPSLPLSTNKDVERYYSQMALKRCIEGDISVSSLIETYHNVLPLAAHLNATEIKPCDNFVKLVTSCYFDKWLGNKGDQQHLIEAVILLVKSIETSPANYHLRLQLSHLYSLFNCQDLFINQFGELQIKQLMWDSLGHHFIIPSLSAPSFDRRIIFLKKNSTRKLKNKLEIEENLVTCYKLGNYGRIPEIIDFHRAIDASVMSCLSETEIIYINTVLKSNSCDDLFESCGNINLKEVESFDSELDIVSSLSHLKDFRDLKTSPDFPPIERSWTSVDQTSSFKHIILWIAQRYLVLRAFYSSAKVTMETVVKLDILSHDSNASFSEDCSNYYKVLKACRCSIADVWSQMSTLSSSYLHLHEDLSGGCREPPHSAFSSFYAPLVLSCIDSVISFHDYFVRKSISVEELVDWNNSLLTPINNGVAIMLLIEVDDKNLFLTLPRIITQMTVLCEMFSVITVNLSLIDNMTKPMRPKPQMKRKNKKRVESTSNDIESTKCETYKLFLNKTKFHTLPSNLIEIITNIDKFISTIKLSTIDLLSIKSRLESAAILEPIYNSWKTSLDDGLQLLNNKKTHLELLEKLLGEHEAVAEGCLIKTGESQVKAIKI